MGRRRKRVGPKQGAISLCYSMGGDEERGAADRLKGFPAESTRKDVARFPTPVSGFRAPGIFKKIKGVRARCAVERAPPYVPEVQPDKLVWNCFKTTYNTRYDNAAPGSDFLRPCFDSPSGGRLLANKIGRSRENRRAEGDYPGLRRYGGAGRRRCRMRGGGGEGGRLSRRRRVV